MKIDLDHISRKRLLLAKQMYQRGIIFSSNIYDKTSRIASVIFFDWANETTLKAVLLSLGKVKSLSKNLNGLIQQLESSLENNIELKTDMVRFVRNIRNAAQHEARYPNEDEVSECRIYSRDFQNNILTIFFGIVLDQLSSTGSIRNKKVKSIFISAEKELDSGNYLASAKSCLSALDYSLNKFRQFSFNVGPTLAVGDIEDINTLSMLSLLQDSILIVAAGINYFDLANVRRIVEQEKITRDEAENVISFSIYAVETIESKSY